jgi:hypothetical protein
VPARAQEEGFTESFDDSELPGWEHSPEVVVVDGVMRISPGNYALKFGDWADLTLDVRLRYNNPGEILIHYYFRDEGTYRLHLMEGAGFLERDVGGTVTELGHGFLDQIGPGTWLDLQISVDGQQHVISVGGAPLIEATDVEPLSAGAILFHSLGEATVEIDDLVVTGRPVHPQPVEPKPAPTGAAPPAGQGTTPGSAGAETGSAGLLEDFLAGQASTSQLLDFLVNMALAAVTSFILSRVYIHWGSSLSNRRRFAANFVLLTMTTTFIILIVRSSVALSLGLVGALSIVRFRTAVKEPEELAYLFFAIGLGIGLGDNQRLITLLALAATVLIVGLLKLVRRPQADVNLHLTVASHNPGKVDLEEILDALNPHCAKLKLLRFDETEDSTEVSFVVEFTRVSNLSQAKAALRELSESVEITFMDNKGVW